MPQSPVGAQLEAEADGDEPLPMLRLAKSESFFFTTGLLQEGQITSLTADIDLTNLSKLPPQPPQSNSYIGIS